MDTDMHAFRYFIINWKMLLLFDLCMCEQIKIYKIIHVILSKEDMKSTSEKKTNKGDFNVESKL